MLINRRYINDVFTGLVNTYISEGYIFSPSMSGHQGEEMKVDLDNGKETVRIRLERGNASDYNEGLYVDTLEIFAETFDKVCKDSWDTLWSGKGNQLYHVVYYKVSEKMYTDDAQFILDRQAKRHERYKSRERKNTVYDYLNSRLAHEIALKFVRRQPGGKTKRLEDIVSVYREWNRAGKAYYSVYVQSGSNIKTFYMRTKNPA